MGQEAGHDMMILNDEIAIGDQWTHPVSRHHFWVTRIRKVADPMYLMIDLSRRRGGATTFTMMVKRSDKSEVIKDCLPSLVVIR